MRVLGKSPFHAMTVAGLKTHLAEGPSEWRLVRGSASAYGPAFMGRAVLHCGRLVRTGNTLCLTGELVPIFIRKPCETARTGPGTSFERSSSMTNKPTPLRIDH